MEAAESVSGRDRLPCHPDVLGKTAQRTMLRDGKGASEKERKRERGRGRGRVTEWR